MTPTTNDGGGDSDPLGPRGGDPGDAEDRPETAEQPESESEAATEDGDGEPGADGPPAGGGSPGGSSTWGKRIAIGLLVVLLTVSVAGAHTLLVAQSTALSADYVTETMDEESVYADLEANATGTIVEAVAGDGAGPTAIPRWEEVVGSSVEELLGANYLRGQITDNVDSAYDFLHGREASLQLAVDTRPLLENVSGVVTRRVAEIPLPELVRAAPVSIPETAGIEITTDRIARAMESESAYRAVRADVRDQVIERAGTSDPDQIDRLLSAANNRITQNLKREVAGNDELDEAFKPAVEGLMTTAVDGLTDPEMSYGEFQSELDGDHQRLASAAGTVAGDLVRSQLGTTLDLDEGLDAGARERLDEVAGYVQLADTLATVLPLVALLLAVLLLVLTHSVTGWARAVGTGLVLVGVPAVLGGVLAKPAVLDVVGEAVPENAEDPWLSDLVLNLVEALVSGLFDTFTTQGLVIAVVGVVLVAASVGLRYAQPEALPEDWR